MAGFHMEFSRGGELFCAFGVEYLSYALSPVNLDLFSVGVLLRSIIALHPHVLYKPCGKTALAHTSSTEHDLGAARRTRCPFRSGGGATYVPLLKPSARTL